MTDYIKINTGWLSYLIDEKKRKTQAKKQETKKDLGFLFLTLSMHLYILGRICKKILRWVYLMQHEETVQQKTVSSAKLF